ncbi:MAG: NAD(P)-dependent oxidoreductase [Actinomycetota bacterium]|nr:NAD(P)-dependent oxidoreductase [Actinomycetota bacterium]
MSKIAFLGLGQMGTPIATRLLDAGHDLVVWNRTPSRARPLAERGAGLASSPFEAAAGVEFAITMLATPEAVEEVLFGTEGLVQGLGPGKILIEMSTIGPAAVHSLDSRMPAGVTMVDAEVRGSVPEAAEGRLHVFVGATDADFARVRPIVELLGDVRHVGGLGAGAAMKLVVNSTLGAAIVALGEALALGQSLGLQRTEVLDVLEGSPIGPTVRAKRSNVESGRYPPSFKLRLADKDLRLVTEAGDGAGLDLRAARATQAWLDQALEQGAGDLDFSAVVATITEGRA